MSILQMSLSIPVTPNSLSSAETLFGGPISARSLCLTTKPSLLPLKTTPIRMGGGPRTFPGGVSKWQWKKMQAKKAKQLLKARLARERQIYEMRKRAELKAAVSELERPWETVERPPNLFSVSADEQLKVLADRFQKPGGLDLWSERDGPELFRADTGLQSARFFPKGVVHSVKPYRKTESIDDVSEEFESFSLGHGSKPNPSEVGGNLGEIGLVGNRYGRNSSSNPSNSNNGRNVNNLEARSLNSVEKQGGNRNLRRNNGRNVNNLEGRSLNGVERQGENRNIRRNSGRNVNNLQGRSLNSVEKQGENGNLRRNNWRNVNDLEGRSLNSVERQGENRNLRRNNGRNVNNLEGRSLNSVEKQGENRNPRRNGSARTYSSDSEGKNYRNSRFYNRDDRSGRPGDNSGEFRRNNDRKQDQSMIPEVFDMSLDHYGNYGFELEKI